MEPKNTLPPTTVILRCETCQAEIGEVSCQEWRFAGEVSRLRREHAGAVHGWQAPA